MEFFQPGFSAGAEYGYMTVVKPVFIAIYELTVKCRETNAFFDK